MRTIELHSYLLTRSLKDHPCLWGNEGRIFAATGKKQTGKTSEWKLVRAQCRDGIDNKGLVNLYRRGEVENEGIRK
jgi:hypothetical protein